MGDHGAIADAGRTLVALLRDRMTGLLTSDQVVLASPVDDDLDDDVRLTVFLFDVDGTTPPSGERRGRATGTDDPLRVELKYLLTAHPGREDSTTKTTARTANEHTVLGRAMQVLDDNAIVEGPDLRGSLADDDERLQVSVLSETADTVVNLWTTFQDAPYRPSVSYLVTPVEIESRRESAGERVEEFRVEEHVRTGGGDE